MDEENDMNPLFESYRNSVPQGSNSFNLNAALQSLAAQIMPTGLTPEQIVRQKIQNGEITQAQLAQITPMADRLYEQLTGRKH